MDLLQGFDIETWISFVALLVAFFSVDSPHLLEKLVSYELTVVAWRASG